MRLSLTLPVLLFSCAVHAQTQDADTSGVRLIEPKPLAEMLSTSKVWVYDCNEPEVYAEAHVPQAIPTVYDALTNNHLPADRDAILVFYCYSPECPAASMAALTAEMLGFTHVYCMPAGITGWQDAGLRTEP